MKKIFKLFAGVLAVCLTVLTFAACGTTSIFSRPTVQRKDGQRKDWLDVSSFICYYGDFDDIQKNFDVVIMHSNTLYSDAEAENKVKQLKEAGCYVIAYITVGEDDTLNTADGLGEGGYASYYIYENGYPKQNTNWNSYFVDAGNPVWQSKIIEEARGILSYGVDGLFLDTLDTVDIASSTMGGMADLVKKLDETFPDAKLIANRGFNLLQYISEHIDGLMFESFNTTWNFTNNTVSDLSEADIAYNHNVACNVINKTRQYDYFPVFALDYVNEFEYSFYPQQCYDNSWKFDFIPYCTYDIMLGTPCDPGVTPQSKRGEMALAYTSGGGLEDYNGDRTDKNLAYSENGAVVTTDSVYPGYNIKPLNDGWYATAQNHVQNNYSLESWASADNKSVDHWIQFEFPSAKDVSKVNVYWANDNDVFYSPQECVIQAYVDGAWTDVATFTNEPEEEGGFYKSLLNKIEFSFEKVNTTRIRVLQPKNKGAADDVGLPIRSGIMWVSEVEIYS